jgi:hypothetical protein
MSQRIWVQRVEDARPTTPTTALVGKHVGLPLAAGLANTLQERRTFWTHGRGCGEGRGGAAQSEQPLEKAAAHGDGLGHSSGPFGVLTAGSSGED